MATLTALIARLQGGVSGWFARPLEQADRYIYPNNPAANEGFCDNLVITCVHAKLTGVWAHGPPYSHSTAGSPSLVTRRT